MNELIKNLKIEDDFIKDLKNYREYNKVIAGYFYKYSLDEKNEKYQKISNNINNCNKIWDINFYKDLNVKEFKKTHLCKNKFCFNCKKVLQAFRMSKYIPVINQYDNLYHLVLTIPNVKGEELKDTLKKMAVTFRRFYGIINGRDKFQPKYEFECLGAIRSLEITFSEKGFHPHYHVLLRLKSPLNLEKTIVNTFSLDYGMYLKRAFSTEEVYLQKLWYCLYNNIRLSQMEDIKNGYSVILDEFHEDDYCELFKYMCKEKAFVEDGEMLLTYYYFKYLYDATYRVKQLQGYGCFFSIKDDFDIEELREGYDEFVKYLTELNEPLRQKEYLSVNDYKEHIKKMREQGFDDDDIKGFTDNFGIVDNKKHTYISFKKYVQLCRIVDNDV